MPEDGKIIIGVDLEDDKFDKKIAKLETRMNRQKRDLEINFSSSKDLEKLNQKLEDTRYQLKLAQYEQESQNKILKQEQIEYETLNDKINKGIALTRDEYIKHGELLNSLANSNQQQKEINVEIEKYNKEIEKISDKIASSEIQYIKQKERINDTRLAIEETKRAQQEANEKFREAAEIAEQERIKQQQEEVKKSIDSIGDSMKGAIKKVTQWGLAVFGLRSAYMFVRQAINTLSQYNQQLATDIQYIRFAIANTLKPVIEWLIQAVYKLLYYIGYILKAWFGINIFANSSAKAFKNSVGSVKELKRQLAGFDEMEVLNDNSNNTSGVGVPSIDLSNVKNFEIPGWIKWIADNKEFFFTIGKVLGTVFAVSTVTKWMRNLGILFDGPTGLGFLLSTIGKIALIGGAIVITGYIAQKLWNEVQEFKKELETIRKNGAKAQEEWLKNEDDINTILNTQNVNREAGYNLMKQSESWIVRILGLDKDNLETAKQTAINIGKQVDKEIELYKAGKLNTEEQERVKQNIIEQIEYNATLIDKLREAGMETSEIETLNNNLLRNYIDMGGDVDDLKNKLSDVNNLSIDDKKMTINIAANTSSAERTANNWLSNLASTAASIGKGILDVVSGGTVSKVEAGIAGLKWLKTKIFKNAKGGIVLPTLPYASGGIINLPGRGIPIGGEAGAEGILPLTDQQQMDLLGESIARHMVVNLTNVTELDGRTINRKLQQVQNNNNFILNR